MLIAQVIAVVVLSKYSPSRDSFEIIHEHKCLLSLETSSPFGMLLFRENLAMFSVVKIVHSPSSKNMGN